LRKLGADQIIDYNTVRFEDAVQPVDIVLDTIGGDIQERSWKVLKRDGVLISIVSPPSAERAKTQGLRQAFVFIQPNAGQLGEIAKLVEAERIKAVVETILPLSDATRGQELSERGHTRGKIVLRVVYNVGP
jgi:NADPH:quinone reductase-like Zn-dependent oxidoreductase